ncbi:MAG TPA: cytochrome c-type biogenesis CcmF C-terminal domain-containing protein [Candidatus Acidoferrales bacterium]|nr:cytochrome c-type biogenesis CcmF C-terminal domain-containing protein [Candidatus Acidoferrales bacterium]
MEQYITIIPLLAAVASIVYYRLSEKSQNFLRPARLFFYVNVLSIMVLYCYFIFLILSHQYQYTYVWSYSSNDLSIPLLLSASYAGQEGSFILWIFYSAVISVFVLRYSQLRVDADIAQRRGRYESIVIPIILLFEIFVLAILTLKSPFAKVWESYSDVQFGMMPQDGRGLNPLLQNFWIVIHPPILFLGFASAIIPFAFAVTGLIRKDYVNWMTYLRPWLLFNVLTLGAGIIIGGYWAYVTLGWGGFWGWDPVENSSLIPWLFSSAALHTIIVGKRTNSFIKTSFSLTIISFILVLYSTFLTRSGVLGDTSVHAFVDPGKSVYAILLVLIGVFLLLGLIPFFRNRVSIPGAGVSHNLLSREIAMFVGAASLSVLSLFALVGTSSPIITGLLQGKPTAVNSSYYVTTSLPLGLLIIALIGFAQLVWWDHSDRKVFLKNLTLPVAAATLTAIAALSLSVKDATVILIMSAAAFAFVAHFAAAVRIVRGNPKYIGGPVTHAGLALMFIGIIASTALESKTTVQLQQGKPVSVFGNEITYAHNAKVEGKDAFMVHLRNGSTEANLKPAMYYSYYSQGTMREPDIKSYFGYDLYVSPLAVDNGGAASTSTGAVKIVVLQKGKQVKLDDGTQLILVRFDMNSAGHDAMQQGGNFMVASLIDASKNGKTIEISPELNFVNGKENAVPAQAFGNMLIVMDMNVGMGGANGTASVRLAVHSVDMVQSVSLPVLTVEVSKKPLIGFLWAGTILLFVGLAISMYRRFAEGKIPRSVSGIPMRDQNLHNVAKRSETILTIEEMGSKEVEVENVEN